MPHQQYNACIEACNACAVACNHCATSCLHETDVKMMVKCIALDMDCAQILRLPLLPWPEGAFMPKQSARSVLTFANPAPTNVPNMTWRIANSVRRPASCALESAEKWPQWPEQFPTQKELIMKFQLKRIASTSVAFAVLGVALLQPLAFAQMQMKPGSEAMPGGKTGTSSMQGGSMDMKGMDMNGMMKDNNDKMSSMKMTGDVDVDFAMMMRIHHQGAIDMAQAQLKDGKDLRMIKMAKSIIADQKKEIAVFDKFLADKGHSGMKMAK